MVCKGHSVINAHILTLIIPLVHSSVCYVFTSLGLSVSTDKLTSWANALGGIWFWKVERTVVCVRLLDFAEYMKNSVNNCTAFCFYTQTAVYVKIKLGTYNYALSAGKSYSEGLLNHVTENQHGRSWHQQYTALDQSTSEFIRTQHWRWIWCQR